MQLRMIEIKWEVPGWYIVGYRGLLFKPELTIEEQNRFEELKRDSFKFGGKYVGRDLYFKTAELREQILTWKALKYDN
jgi:hypothetical protein